MLEEILKKLSAGENKKLTAAKADEDFLPYVCHYDKNTILTKNGELMQIIRITGLSGDGLLSSFSPLRDSLRDAIFDNAKDTGFAFWFHTIRRKKDINPRGFYQDYTSSALHDACEEEYNWKNNFVNELYVSIISEGLETSVSDFKAFAKTFSYKSTQKIHGQHLKKAHAKLSELGQKILIEIEEHGAKLLGIKEWESVLYSEPMRFFGKIANLCEDRYPLSINDIASELSTHKIAFGEREIEVVGDGNKNFATIMTIKEYHEVSVESLDKILQLPFEFIITQSFDFFFEEKDLAAPLNQDRILKISQDDYFRQVSGVANFVESNTNSPTDYGKLQSSLMIISNNRQDLEKDVAMAIEKFSALGYIMVREDIFLEHCFWAQLPANFSFLRRQKIINTLRIGGFAALNSFPQGSIGGNHWGSAVATLKTVLDTPYFFNFHDKDCGHTLILGPNSSGKTVIVNFLLLMARKFQNKIFYFDFEKSAKCFVKSISGKYHKLTKDIEHRNFMQLNPMSLENNEENIKFLRKWLKQLIIFLKGDIDEKEFDAAENIIRKVLAARPSNFLALFDALRNDETPNIYEKLKIWGSGKLAYIFGSQDEIDFSNPVQGFNFDEIMDQKPILIPTVFYLLHKIEQSLTGEAAIVVFERTREFLDNPIFAEELDDILKRLRAKNCMVIFNIQDGKNLQKSLIAKVIAKNVATELYTANSGAKKHYMNLFDLNLDEFEVVKILEPQQHHALLKHNNDSIIIDFDLSFLQEFTSILSADEVSLATLEEIMETDDGQNPEEWIPQILEIVKEFNRQQKEELLAKQKQEFEDEKRRKMTEEGTEESKPEKQKSENDDEEEDENDNKNDNEENDDDEIYEPEEENKEEEENDKQNEE